MNAGELVVSLVNPGEDLAADAPMLSELRDLADREAVLAGQCSRILATLDTAGTDDDSALSGDLLKAINTTYNERSAELAEVQRERRRLNNDLAAARLARAQGSDLAPEQILELVATLRDPTDLSMRNVMLPALQNVDITVTGHTNKTGGASFTATGDLVVALGDSAWSSSGRATTKRAHPQAPRWRSRTSSGAGRQVGHRLVQSRARVAAQLGTTQRVARFVNLIDEPRLMRIHVACLENPDTAAVATAAGEPVQLVERIRAIHDKVHASNRLRWVLEPSPTVDVLYREAARCSDRLVRGTHLSLRRDELIGREVLLAYVDLDTEWDLDVRGRGLKLNRRCDHCEEPHSDFSRGRLREITGSGARPRCGHDAGGLQWPVDLVERHGPPQLIEPSARSLARRPRTSAA